MSLHDLLARWAREAPDAPALIDRGRTVTYGAHHAATEALAETLAAKGLRPGDRLLIVAENAAETAALVFAASRAGAVAVPVNARLTAPELARIERHAGPRLVAYTTGASPDAAAHARETDNRADGIALRPGAHPTGGPAPEGSGVILYTTGTTGDPKGVVLTQDNLAFGARTSATLRGMRKGDVVYGALPVTHVFGLSSMLIAATTVGACVRLEARFSAAALHDALRDDVTIFPGVPQMHALLMAHVAQAGLDRLRGVPLRYVSSGAAPLDPAWKRKAEAFYGLPLQNGYGMTETTAGISATSDPMGHPGIDVGPPLPGVEVRLDTTKGGVDPEVGEVLTRGPHVMAGYWRDPARTAEAIEDGWARTGDLGTLTDGRLAIVGRAKELILRGGFNVYPPEVEAALNDHPDVIQSAVIGRPIPGGDEEVLAFVQCADPDALDLAALRETVAARLAPYKRPARIVAARALPAAPTGKPLKHKLLEAFAAELSEDASRH